MQRLLFDFLFFSLGGTVGVIAMCILQAGHSVWSAPATWA